MNYSLDDYLAVGVPALSASGLVAPDQIAAMRVTARRLPPSADFGFECRLSDDDATLDLGARLVPDDGTRAAYAGRNPSARVAPELLRCVEWRRLQAMCAAWATITDSLHTELADMWLELDHSELAAEVPMPCVFVKPRAEAKGAPRIIARALGILLHDADAELDLPPAALRCFAALPAGARVMQAGVMASRPASPIRLVIEIDAADLRAFLADVDWSGSFAELDRFIDEIEPFGARCVLDVDVRDTVSPRIGFECYGDEREQPEAALARLLERLGALGLCSPRKASAITRWSGVTGPASTVAPWPANLTAAALRLGCRSAFLRRLSHFKIVYSDGIAPTAKAYFGLSHRWLKAAPRDGHESVSGPFASRTKPTLDAD